MRSFRWLVISLLAANLCQAEPHWPAFRGPSGQGWSHDARVPLKWSESENVAWKSAIPGKGWSSPVLWGEEIWLTTAITREANEQERRLQLNDPKQASQQQVAKSISLRAISIDRHTGEIRSNREMFQAVNPAPIHLLNSFASPTPVIDEGKVYCHFGTYGTACLDTASGDVKWRCRLPSEHGVGPGSSPIRWQNLLILVCDGMDAQYVTWLDTETGEVAWRTDRPPMSGSDGDLHKAFSTPLLVSWNGEDQVVVAGAQWFVAYEPRTGQELWRVNHGSGFSNVAAPVFADGISYLITGFTKPELWAVPVSLRGEFDASRVLWEQRRQIPKKSSPVLVGQAIYLISDSGVLSCVDINTGEIRWSERLGGNYSASPIVVDEKIIVCSHEGKVTIFKPHAEKFEPLAENQLDGQLMASPLPADGALFIRSDNFLYRLQDF